MPAELGDHDHEGHPGWRIDQLDANIVNWLNATDPRTILLHIRTDPTRRRTPTAPSPGLRQAGASPRRERPASTGCASRAAKQHDDDDDDEYHDDRAESDVHGVLPLVENRLPDGSQALRLLPSTERLPRSAGFNGKKKSRMHPP
ncbi:hypothetical protein [Streptomyces sp. CA-111067]|uniref:hypothetical protein n=1 Tax=Streptomyces sp. CA-111067 TaxID=3240046 RepID=UPI003D9A0AAD